MRIILFLVIILLMLIIFSNKSIEKSSKIVFTVLLLIVFGAGYLYEDYIEAKQDRNLLKIEAFKQGKKLICKGGIVVDDKHFDYFSGTQTFAPNKQSKYVDVILSIDECKVSDK